MVDLSWTQEQIDAEVERLELRGDTLSTVVETRPFINGVYQNGVETSFVSYNPANGKPVASIAACDGSHVDLAVQAARASFEKAVWANKSPEERKNILLEFASLIQAHTLELAVLDSVEGTCFVSWRFCYTYFIFAPVNQLIIKAGKSIADNLQGDVPNTVKCLQFHAECINKMYDQVAPTPGNALGLIVREPVGVVGLIVPWNFPLLMAAWKLAPALACGNSVVLKPAELTSLSALRLGQLSVMAGIPPGVLNIVPGLGSVAGAALSSHMDVDMIGFTGSTVTGRKVLAAAASSNLKRVSLELGGKSPQIVFDDADLDAAVPHIMAAAFWNQSENCSCGSRLIVQRAVKEQLLAKLKTAATDFTMGDPLQLSSKCGSMISPDHCQKVLDYIQSAHDEGAKCILGGGKVMEETGGSFVGLTIFDGVIPSMKIAAEEIFGPVLSVMEFETEEQAIALANATVYGLAASLYSTNIHRAMRVSKKIRAGNVSVNCFAEGDDTTPFGGYKQSGFVGRDKSIFAHEQYQEIKTIWYNIAE